MTQLNRTQAMNKHENRSKIKRKDVPKGPSNCDHKTKQGRRSEWKKEKHGEALQCAVTVRSTNCNHPKLQGQVMPSCYIAAWCDARLWPCPVMNSRSLEKHTLKAGPKEMCGAHPSHLPTHEPENWILMNIDCISLFHPYTPKDPKRTHKIFFTHFQKYGSENRHRPPICPNNCPDHTDSDKLRSGKPRNSNHRSKQQHPLRSYLGVRWIGHLCSSTKCTGLHKPPHSTQFQTSSHFVSYDLLPAPNKPK